MVGVDVHIDWLRLAIAALAACLTPIFVKGLLWAMRRRQRPKTPIT